MGEEADDEKKRYENLDETVCSAIAAGAVAAAEHFLDAKMKEGEADDEAYDKWAYGLVRQQSREEWYDMHTAMIAKQTDICLILDNIRSVHNVGSLFRTAETIGISKIFCAGTTPTPLDRFGRARPDFAKVSLGAEKTVAWEYVANTMTAVRRLKKAGYKVVALEQHEESIDYKDFMPAEHQAVIVGNEVDGVSSTVLKHADAIAEIPMRGNKESLNVAVATGVVLFRWFDR